MTVKHLNLPETPYCVVGSKNLIVLEQEYDTRQLWFDFEDVILFREESNSSKKITHVPISKTRINRVLRPPNSCLSPYIPEIGVDQMVLPFQQWQIPSRAMNKKLKAADYPAFERDEDGKPYHHRHTGKYKGGVSTLHSDANTINWVHRNCIGRVILERIITFEAKEDAVLAIMTGNFSKYEA